MLNELFLTLSFDSVSQQVRIQKILQVRFLLKLRNLQRRLLLVYLKSKELLPTQLRLKISMIYQVQMEKIYSVDPTYNLDFQIQLFHLPYSLPLLTMKTRIPILLKVKQLILILERLKYLVTNLDSLVDHLIHHLPLKLKYFRHQNLNFLTQPKQLQIEKISLA